MNMGVGFGMGSFTFILLLIIKLLFVLFIVGLTVGIVVYVFKHIFTAKDIQQLKGTFNGSKNAKKDNCVSCGKDLDNEWKVCPFCGNEKITTNE